MKLVRGDAPPVACHSALRACPRYDLISRDVDHVRTLVHRDVCVPQIEACQRVLQRFQVDAAREPRSYRRAGFHPLMGKSPSPANRLLPPRPVRWTISAMKTGRGKAVAITHTMGSKTACVRVAVTDGIPEDYAEAARQLGISRARMSQVIDEEDLRQALAEFDAGWAELSSREQARVMRLLVEVVTYDAEKGAVGITFRPGGVRMMAQTEEGQTA